MSHLDSESAHANIESSKENSADKSHLQRVQAKADYLTYQKERDLLISGDAYRLEDEHDNCGVGVLCDTRGKASRRVVRLGLEALGRLKHRGALGADGQSGDGCGVMLQLSASFFDGEIEKLGHTPVRPAGTQMAVGMLFMPKDDLEAQERSRSLVESEVQALGYRLCGWRQVPTDVDHLGARAYATRPEIYQVFVRGKQEESVEVLERQLYLIRRRIENRARKLNLSELYICSLSCQHIVYKGMVVAEKLADFFTDLQDARMQSSFVIFHQRYSTNTFPQWRLAQPFRTVAHNGEINTLRSNKSWMRVHERRMTSEVFGDYVTDLKPIVQPGGSDSAALDNVFEVLVRSGRSAGLAKSMLIPEAWRKKQGLSEDMRAFYAYCDALMKPWDGPAAVVASDGRFIIAGMDRHGLRPLRYTRTDQDLLMVASEAGLLATEAVSVIEQGRIGPGGMIGVDLKAGTFLNETDLKNALSDEKPYAQLGKHMRSLQDVLAEQGSAESKQQASAERLKLSVYQRLAGYSREVIQQRLLPMVSGRKEALASMGHDAALAPLSSAGYGFVHYFKQHFSQVTNPPLDPVREDYVMDLTTRFGNLVNVLSEKPLPEDVLYVDSPLLLSEEFYRLRQHVETHSRVIDTTYEPHVSGEGALVEAIERVKDMAAQAAAEGTVEHIILSDRQLSADRAALPAPMVVSAVHQHLIDRQLRAFVSLHVSTSEVFEPHGYALLVSLGATTVHLWLAEETVYQMKERGKFAEGRGLSEVAEDFRSAMNAGLLKIMSKMGISMVSSYRGGMNYEALGLSRSLVNRYFPGMVSKLSGLGVSDIEKQAAEHLQAARRAINSNLSEELPTDGLLAIRKDGAQHAMTPDYVRLLQKAIKVNSYTQYKEAVSHLGGGKAINVRDLLSFKRAKQPSPHEEVESLTSLRKRFLTPGMSLGALSYEAHGALNVAMNRIGAKSVSGEGGEDPKRYRHTPGGDSANSKVKQVASGRFGVTATYLNECSEIEIKVAQGAKPGEGGQLPGFKVSPEIAFFRHSTPGVTLISPPPHHDIYSIEDLAQLIFDLKQINPRAKVCVKLVSQTGVGTVAVGVAKAHADIILISGGDGGTGASPQSSILHAGLPWEVGLAEAHQLLVLNRLRDRVVLRTDGGMRRGRDMVVAAMLGAEEFGVGTVSLLALGCLLVRQCHSNTCPVGICTQDEDLRQRFTGTPEKVIRLFSFMAEEVREFLSELGVARLDEIVGRSDLLQPSSALRLVPGLDLTPLLLRSQGVQLKPYAEKTRNEVPATLDDRIIMDAQGFFEAGDRMELAYHVRNTDRSLGSRLSSAMLTRRAERVGRMELQPAFHQTNSGLSLGLSQKALTQKALTQSIGDQAIKTDSAYLERLQIHLRGSCGQSLGAFAVEGLKLIVTGEANDYVGKGLSGATVVVRPYPSSRLVTYDNALIGNTSLYGATSGYLFAAGQAGERFAVRNSGALAVIEGCGANGCEYMTGGVVLVLGGIGSNFAAGMTGGMAFVWNPRGSEAFSDRVNFGDIRLRSLKIDAAETEWSWEKVCKELLAQHVEETESEHARDLLAYWSETRRQIVQVCPREMEGIMLDAPTQQIVDRLIARKVSAMQENDDQVLTSVQKDVAWRSPPPTRVASELAVPAGASFVADAASMATHMPVKDGHAADLQS